jgi:hypothetical protein
MGANYSPEIDHCGSRYPVAGFPAKSRAHGLRLWNDGGSAMTQVLRRHSMGDFIVGLLEHTAFVVVGFVMMILGLGLGVTVIMLPVGLVIGLLGLAMFVGGLTVRIGQG